MRVAARPTAAMKVDFEDKVVVDSEAKEADVVVDLAMTEAEA